MKRIRVLFLTAFLLLGLLAGCGSEDNESTTEATIPASEKEAKPTATEVIEAVNTVILKESDTLHVEYVLTALNPNAEYVGSAEVSINSQGAEALAKWLLNQTTLDEIAAFGDELFLASENAPVYSGWISDAAENTKTVRLMTTVNLQEIGLLDAILPAFEEEYGYSVEIVAVEEGEAYIAAALGEADLILAPAPVEGDVFADDNYFRQMTGFSDINVPIFGCPYVLCGPADDPAGAADCADMTAAFAAIADARCYFISRGDYSDAHAAEMQLWAEEPAGEWYFPADTEMGPCLTIAEEMGGYVLCDKLTFEIFRSLNGIIG